MAIVLILVLVFSTLGLGLLQLSTSNATDTSKDIDRTRAFWAAEAGLQEARARATLQRNRAVAHSLPHCFPPYLTWPSTNAMVHYDVEITDQGTTPPSYTIQSQGISPRGTALRLINHLSQTNALPSGLFAVHRLRVREGTGILSYDSASSLFPWFSAASASIGANGEIDLPATPDDLDLVGTLIQGMDPYSGAIATLDCEPNCDLFGPVRREEIDPDPLGIFPPGPLAERLNDPVVWHNVLVDVDQTNDTLFTSGDYYIHDLILHSNATLAINVGNGPVNVFLTGSFLARTNAHIDVNLGPPSHFRIFANGTPPERVVLHSDTSLGLFLYAPGMDVAIESGGSFRGGVWGRNVDIKIPDSSFIFIDRKMLTYNAFDPWPMYRLVFSGWANAPPTGPSP